jgi:hypothetical protein
LIIWITLLALPIQGFASATASFCVPPPAAAQHGHDHEAMSYDDASGVHAHEHAGPDMQTNHHPSSHHQSGKCAACATCGFCVSMAPSFTAVLPVSASPSMTVPFEQHIPPSVDLAFPERPPRA